MCPSCSRSYWFGCLCGLDVLFLLGEDFTFSGSMSVLRAVRLQSSFCFYDVLLEYSASLFGWEMLPPAVLDRFDPFYSSWKGFHNLGFQKAVAEIPC